MHEELAMIMQAALKAATPSMRELADETGLRYSTMRSWSAGIRVPSPENARSVAKILRQRAALLAQLADDLEALATEDQTKTESDNNTTV